LPGDLDSTDCTFVPSSTRSGVTRGDDGDAVALPGERIDEASTSAKPDAPDNSKPRRDDVFVVSGWLEFGWLSSSLRLEDDVARTATTALLGDTTCA
jgi:hypothetical protein|tara:strand:+ start:379 stop:669 length:291 start_codon:yes stop_codon:yes gene_type:complete